jgi:ferredoxin-type protein NapG/ferredoxin-type protein NapH
MLTLSIGGVLSLLLGDDAGASELRLIRPPGALDETSFLATCLRCGQCAQVCPRHAIKIGKGEKGLSIGTPYIEPRQAACDLCLECIKVCTSRALRPVEKDKVRMGQAVINKDTCLAWQGDECKVCYTSCPFYNCVIKLEEHKRPVVDPDVCVGCGICEHVCIVTPAAATIKAGR